VTVVDGESIVLYIVHRAFCKSIYQENIS